MRYFILRENDHHFLFGIIYVAHLGDLQVNEDKLYDKTKEKVVSVLTNT